MLLCTSHNEKVLHTCTYHTSQVQSTINHLNKIHTQRQTCIQYVNVIIEYFSAINVATSAKYEKPFTNECCTVAFPWIRGITS